MNPFRRDITARLAPLAEQPAPKVAGGTATLRLYDPIDSWGGVWGVSAKEFAATLDALPDDTTEIKVLINSPGGEVWEGLAILNQLRSHPAKVVAVVEGIAASAASFIAAGADELQIMKNAEMFVHRAWGLAIGNAEDMAKLAEDLEHEDRNLASIYADKAGGTVDDWLAAMSTETWYSAEEAVKAGLADRVIEPQGSDSGAAKAKARFDLSALHARSARAQQPPAEPAESTPPTKGAGMPDLKAGLRERLGIKADAELDDDGFLAAVDEALAERVEPTTAVPPGAVLIDQAVLANLQAAAAQGQEARAQQVSDRRNSIVQAAITDGRITPASRDKWLNALATDEEGMGAVLAALAPGLVPLEARGYTGGVTESSDDDRIYAAAFGKGA